MTQDERDLSRSLQFRYKVDDVSLGLFWLLVALAALVCAVGLLLMLLGPLTGLFSWGWGGPQLCLRIFIFIAMATMVVQDLSEHLRNWSHYRDAHAGRQGLSYWPFERQ